MLIKDYASLEAVIDKGEPSRLLIEIALRPASPRRTCARLRPGRSPARDSRGFPRGSRPKSSSSGSPGRRSRRNRGRGDGSAGPSLSWLCAATRQRNDPSSVGVPYRASICRRIVGAAALRSGGAIDRSPEPGFAIDRRARDVERRAGRAADGSGYVRAARTVGPKRRTRP